MKKSVFIFLGLLMAVLSLTVTGCEEKSGPTPTPTPVPQGFDLATTLVPDADFDIYVFARQVDATLVPGSIVDISGDFSVDSLALWGVNYEDSYAISGGLTITGADGAARLFDQVPEDAEFWAGITGDTVYFVYESETVGRELKGAIQSGRFKPYDNETALAELALFPDGGSTNLGAAAVAAPDRALANLVAKYTDPKIAGLIDIVLNTANIEVITAGFYSPGPIDVAAAVREIEATGWFEGDIGVLASVKSAWPELMFGPIAGAALEAAGFPRVEMGGIIAYRSEIEITDGKRVPILFAAVKNRLYIAISSDEVYAESLLKGLDIQE